MATQETIEKAKSWVEKEYDDLRYSKCQCKGFVFTFRELKEMAKKAFVAGHESEAGWHDLRKDPKDLPKSYKVVYNQVGEKTTYDPERGFLGFPGAGIIAWREIEVFEKN